MSEMDRRASKSNRRKRLRLLKVAIVTLIVAILLGVSLLLLSNQSSEIPPTPSPTGVSYVTHDPILINGNAQFNNTNYPGNGVVSGNGTVTNPYVIEGWSISKWGYGSMINILNTNMHFIIRYCSVGYPDGNGIHLYNCVNGTLIYNTCSNNWFGISLVSSMGITIRNNTCTWNAAQGIRLETTSNNNNLSCNQISNNGFEGIIILSGSKNLIWNNILSSNNGAGTVRNLAHIQAYDSGSSNQWYLTGSPHGYGNYWGDLTTPDANSDGIVDYSYNLTGSAGAKDFFPLTTQRGGIPEPSILILAGIMIVAFVTIGRVRKKP